jgi:poly-D-alanine transfer protein DltD
MTSIYNNQWNRKQGSDPPSQTKDSFSNKQVSKFLLNNKEERRERLHQVVQGYPNLKRITNLLKED